MTIPKRNLRSLQDIPTLSGRVDQVSEPYRAYMRISCLEMEKVRRGKERESAMHRVNNIEERFREIEKEKALLLKRVGGLNTIKTLSTSGNIPKQRSSLHPGAFKIKY